MERFVEQTYLYDFYGELLTQHQRQIYNDYVLDNLSISEIADENGISRQAVHDQIKKIDRILAGYEEKLHLVEKFIDIKGYAGDIARIAKGLGGDEGRKIIELARSIDKEL